MASSSSHPPPGTAKASGDDSEVPTADAGTMDTGSVGDESVDGSRPRSYWQILQIGSGLLPFLVFLTLGSDQRGGYMQPVPIDFEFPCSAAADWFHWVADEFMDAEFCALLERAGVWLRQYSFRGVAICIGTPRRCGRFCGEMVCASTHTFFFSWGELTITLEDVENHWLLPVLGDMDPFAVEMSEEETVVEQALTRLGPVLESMAWSVYFAKATEPTRIRRGLSFVAYWLYSVCLDEIRGGSLVILLLPASILSALQTFLWERSLNYQEVGNDNSPNKGKKFKNTCPAPNFLKKTVSCHSVMYWFSDIASQSFELSPDDTRSLTYLSAVNPGWLPVWSDEGVKYTHYCPNRVRRQFGLDQSVPGSPSETLPRTPNMAPFLNDHAFDYWSASVSRMVIPCGGRLGICTVAMQEYWLRVAAAMADYVRQGRGTKVPLPNHHAHPMETTTLSPPTQTAISYAERQGLGFAEWDGPRDGWILYSTAIPSSWKESVKVVEERLRLDSKRGKGSKKTDSGKGASSPAASKQKPKSAAKASSKRPKVAMDMSMIPPSELGDRALMAPGTSKKKQSAAGASKRNLLPTPTKAKSQPRSKSVAVKKAKSKPTRKSAVAPPSSSEEPAAESATPVEKESAIPTPPSTIYDRTRSKRKAVAEQVRSQAKRKVGDKGEGSDRVPIVIEEVSGGDDVVDAGAGTTEVNESITERQEVALEPTDGVAAKDSPIDWTDSDDAMADEALGVTVSDEAVLVMADEAVQSTTSIMAEEAPGETPVSMADVVPEAREVTPVMADVTLVSMADETLVDVAHETAPVTVDETLAGMADRTPVSIAYGIIPVVANFNTGIIVGSAAEEDYDPGTDSVDSEEAIADEPQPLQIIPFADQPDEPRANDPIEFHLNPPFARMTSVVEGVSLFGVAPHFGRILREEGSPMVVIDHPSSGAFTGGQVPALEGIPIQGADGGGTADTEVRGVGVVPEDVEAPVLVEKESVAHVVSAAPSSSQTRSAVEVIIPGRVAAFFASFEERAPNPYPDWHFWRFEGPLVAYGNFWVYQDAVPLLQGLSAKFGDFTTHFKFGAGFGGPMISLLGSVLADMRRTSFKTLSESKILSWRSVVQDLIAVGFDLDFLLEHLRKVARKFFGEAIASEMKVVQEQISSLQSTLAVLVSYQGELMSAAAASPTTVEVASPIDGLFD
uniref:Aminotransferase-like plant mobile domain-containing protein n=1 Tax=Fagus sylvatica TaxID=28930 RepID=A0A2N9HIE7_FAGSY